MFNKKFSFEEPMNWFLNKWYRMAAVGILGMLVFSIGFDTTFFLPGRMRQAAISDAHVAIDEALINYATATDRFAAEGLWFKKGQGYVDELEFTLEKIEALLDSDEGARILLKDAQAVNNYRQAIDLAHQTVAKAENAGDLSQQVVGTLDALVTERNEARNRLGRVNDELTITQQILDLVSARFSGEKNKYLTRYTNELDTKIRKGQAHFDEANTAWAIANQVMPDNVDLRGNGDPRMAESELDRAKTAIDEITTLMSVVTSRLNYLALADVLAEPKGSEAQVAYTEAASYVDTTHRRTQYWLRSAYTALTEAKDWLDTAIKALGTVVENNLVDKPAAYEAALASIDRSGKAVAETDNEVAAADAARKSIQLISERIVEVAGYISRADASRSILISYHASAVWSDIASNIDMAREKVDRAVKSRDTAAQYIDLSVQRFSDAKSLTDETLSELEKGQSLAQAVINRTDMLERYRSQYPNAYSSAQNTITAQTGNVTAYGSYDWGALNDYNDAVRLLSESDRDAASGYYQSAVEKADLVSSKANGTGARAYAAYEAHQRAEEEARRRAEEEARRVAQDSDDDYFDSGGSSGDDGGYDFSDSGSSGGGYDDFGDYGGSDSDFDFSSDSDW